ncbi:MAG: cysteine rich repeat-containing protein [Elusimicrobiales bacterium]|nr:cysteine rich repeat-containing protein [Elusimicrobiales bacterium]
MKNYILVALTLGGLGLALSLPAAAEKGKGPCAADAAKFCKDVKPGEGRVAACLKEHEKELSQACTDRRALAAEKKGKRGGKFARRGNRGGGSCMREYGQGFGAGFRNGFKMRAGLGGKNAKAKRNKGAKVCAADVQKLCGEVKPGEGRVRDCLIKNVDKLSEGCKTRTEKVKVRLEEKGKKV